MLIEAAALYGAIRAVQDFLAWKRKRQTIQALPMRMEPHVLPPAAPATWNPAQEPYREPLRGGMFGRHAREPVEVTDFEITIRGTTGRYQ